MQLTWYNTVCPLVLLPEHLAKEWSGLYLKSSGEEYDRRVSVKDSEDPGKTDYGKVIVQFASLEQHIAFFDHEGHTYLAFDVPEQQEVDYAVVQIENTTYIIRYCLEPDEDIIEILNEKTLADRRGWQEEGELQIDQGNYLVFDSGTHYMDLEREEVAQITITIGEYQVSTKALGQNTEFLVHRLQRK
ncbi:MAG: hypothetical protein AAF518_06510 [Spirochaetota bacterium]